MVGYGTAAIGVHVVSLRDDPRLLPQMIRFFQAQWGSPNNDPLYADCLTHSVAPVGPLPQWYLALTASGQVVGGCGLIPNDFISRMDLMAWLCALAVRPPYRHQGVSRMLVARVVADAAAAGFDHLYLGTDLTDFYERQGFSYLGEGYQPWGDRLRIYQRPLQKV